MAELRVVMTRGGPPKSRPELWWRCLRDGQVGHQPHEGGPLVPMRRLTGGEAGCSFCGAEESTVAGAAREHDGELRDWVVRLACGVSNVRRLPRQA